MTAIPAAGAPAIISYTWDFGDGTRTTTTVGTVSHIYTSIPAGYTSYPFVVTVTATGVDGRLGIGSTSVIDHAVGAVDAGGARRDRLEEAVRKGRLFCFSGQLSADHGRGSRQLSADHGRGSGQLLADHGRVAVSGTRAEPSRADSR